MINNIKCFILAGGESKRFGKDKSKIFYKLIYKKCKKIFKEVYLVAKTKKFKKYKMFIEKNKEYAPIYPLFEIISKYKKAFIISVDTPAIKIESIKKLLKLKRVAKNNPLIGYYSYLHLKTIKKRMKSNKKIFHINREFSIPSKELININYKKDFNKSFLKYH